MLLPAAGGVAAMALTVPAQATGASGAQIYARCAACHTQTGAGVPGAFPPLGADFRNLAAQPAGRRYLVLVVIKGVMGPITVEGKPYRSVMPAQTALDDDEVAAVLNHVGTAIARTGPRFRAFTAREVAAVRAGAGRMTPAEVGRLHAVAGGR